MAFAVGHLAKGRECMPKDFVQLACSSKCSEGQMVVQGCDGVQVG